MCKLLNCLFNCIICYICNNFKNLVKNFYPENYKLDLSETMKAALSKGVPTGAQTAGVQGVSPGIMLAPSGSSNNNHNTDMNASNSAIPGSGFVTEKLYMLLQLYLQNKGWNPSAELLQCFSDLKDSAMLPSAAYLQLVSICTIRLI